MHNRFRNIHLTYNVRELAKRSERALRIIMYFRFSLGTYDYLQIISQNTNRGNINIAFKYMFELNCHLLATVK